MMTLIKSVQLSQLDQQGVLIVQFYVTTVEAA